VLVERLLTNPESGAIAAAATTSLPERIGGDKNWDYRYGWIRDTALALESLLAVRLTVDCHRTLAWVLEASARTNPDVRPFYGLHGETDLPRFDVDVAGYQGSRPVRVGNDAHRQLQLGGFGDIMDAAYRYCSRGHILDSPDARRLAVLADRVCELWHHDDSGIWEIEPRPYTNSKMACWAMLDHAVELAETGQLPDENVREWRDERAAIRSWVDEHGWSEQRQTFVGWAGGDELDASVLLAARWGIVEPTDERYLSTVRVVREELGAGPFLYRLTGSKGDEGCFLACSFWLVDGLARAGRVDEAGALMEELLPAANDVGLYAEMIDPDTRELLGNFPQALTHLSLILAAVSVMRAERAQL
jgi:GH15 family glucan-1,4-alpha-glucosidase